MEPHRDALQENVLLSCCSTPSMSKHSDQLNCLHSAIAHVSCVLSLLAGCLIAVGHLNNLFAFFAVTCSGNKVINNTKTLLFSV